MKKSLLLSLFLCSAMFGFAQTTATVNGWTYQLNDNGTATITAATDGSATGNITIPATIENKGKTYKVTQIGGGDPGVFQGKSLIGITFEGSNLEVIGGHAFKECANLKQISLPRSLKTIGDWGFENCGLEEIAFPSSMDMVKTGVFYNCVKLKTITIPDNITLLSNNCFERCTALTTINGGKGLKDIYDYAFKDCSSLTEFQLPAALTHIYKHAFEGTTSYKVDVDLSQHNEIWIGDHAFQSSGITSFEFPKNGTLANEGYQFQGCTNLKSLTLPDNENCTFLPEGIICDINDAPITSLTIPAHITTLKDWVFNNANNLKEIALPGVTDLSHQAYNEKKGIVYYITDNCTNIGSFTAKKTCSVNIGSTKYATFSSICPLDFSATGLKVYAAKYTDDKVVYTEVKNGKVPAGAGYLLNGEAKSYDVAVATEANDLTENDLAGTATVSKTCDGTQYGLGQVDGKLGWYRVKNGTTIGLNKAYLTIHANTGAKEFIPLDGIATAIKGIAADHTNTENPIYNLAGQKVIKSYKGIVIMNGKKIINK